MLTTMTQIGCTNIEGIPVAKTRRLSELVGRDADDNLARVRLEIQLAEEGLVNDTKRNYASPSTN
jgi:hypothetical protein